MGHNLWLLFWLGFLTKSVKKFQTIIFLEGIVAAQGKCEYCVVQQ